MTNNQPAVMSLPLPTASATARRSVMLLCSWAAILIASMAATPAETPPKVELKTETFDCDPRWEGHNNRIPPKRVLIAKQDFGYSATQFAGKAPGEMGGRIQRSTTPASYAVALAPAKTLDDKLTASGSFAVTASQGGAGVFLG